MRDLVALSLRYIPYSLIIVITVISFQINALFLSFGVWANIDDGLYVKIANEIINGNWLGEYDQLTLAKGPFFPLFLAFNHFTGIPFKLTQHILYLIVVYGFSWGLGRLTSSRTVFLLTYLVMAISPLTSCTALARVIRDPIYAVLALALIALFVAFVRKLPGGIVIGLLLGLVAGSYWLTREEGIWLIPALLVLSWPFIKETIYLLRQRQWPKLLSIAKYVAVPVLVFITIIVLISALNFFNYGVFRTNDFRSEAFREAYGSLSRIRNGEWQRYVVFPKESREWAYSASSAARELRPYLDGPQGKAWAASRQNYPEPWGCVNNPIACNDEILSAWFIWAFRDAVAAAGYFKSAKQADLYFSQLAIEINASCEQQTIPCRDARSTLFPVWRGHYLRDAWHASLDIFSTLMGLTNGQVGIEPSLLNSRQAKLFQFVLNSPVNGYDKDGNKLSSRQLNAFERTLYFLAVDISRIYAQLSRPLFFAAIVGYFFMLWMAYKVKSQQIGFSVLILTALLVGIVCRVGMLGFLEATSIPSNNLVYLMPAIHMYLLFTAFCLGLVASTVFKWIGKKAAATDC